MNIPVRASQEYRPGSDWSLFAQIFWKEFRKTLMFLEYCEKVGFIFEVGSHTFAIESLKHVQSIVMVKKTKMKTFFFMN